MSDLERISNPHKDKPIKELLIESGAIDLVENHTVTELENGYLSIDPIDPERMVSNDCLKRF